VDGAGDYHTASEALRRVIDEAGLPLDVDTFIWSHGRGRILADQTDYAYARCQGQRLAASVCAYQRNHPENVVYLLGHSAGSAVALAAAENLAPESVERIILLAPSVSAQYDLRRALQTTRCGLDVFTSGRDQWSLGLGIALVGTADREPGPAAGRVGFAPHVATPQDAALYARLRQHPWDPCLEWTGNRGGHYGAYQDNYLRAYVLPLLK
jgi:pimeloyl-ACP methyl ester carboxylesterase